MLGYLPCVFILMSVFQWIMSFVVKQGGIYKTSQTYGSREQQGMEEVDDPKVKKMLSTFWWSCFGHIVTAELHCRIDLP